MPPPFPCPSLRMIGTGRFRLLYEKGAGADEMIKMFEADAAGFKERRKRFLLY